METNGQQGQADMKSKGKEQQKPKKQQQQHQPPNLQQQPNRSKTKPQQPKKSDSETDRNDATSLAGKKDNRSRGAYGNRPCRIKHFGYFRVTFIYGTYSHRVKKKLYTFKIYS